MKVTKELKLNNLSIKTIEGYGNMIKIPEPGEQKPLLSSDFFNHYGPLAYMPCDENFELGITTFKNRPLSVEQLEQHAKTAELLLALDGDMIIPAAKIVMKDGMQFPDEFTIQALFVKSGEGIVFHEGIWHWAPFPAGNKESSSVLVGFKAGTAQNDIIIRELDDEYIIVR